MLKTTGLPVRPAFSKNIGSRPVFKKNDGNGKVIELSVSGSNDNNGKALQR